MTKRARLFEQIREAWERLRLWREARREAQREAFKELAAQYTKEERTDARKLR